jgi:hypothetical protein
MIKRNLKLKMWAQIEEYESVTKRRRKPRRVRRNILIG